MAARAELGHWIAHSAVIAAMLLGAGTGANPSIADRSPARPSKHRAWKLGHYSCDCFPVPSRPLHSPPRAPFSPP